jgi:heme A synthase
MKPAHTLPLLAVALAIAAILTGAYITSVEVVGRLSQSAVEPNQMAHRIAGGAMLLLAIALAIRIPSRAGTVRALGWTGPGMLVLIVATGWRGCPLSPGLGVLHALLAHLLFAAAVVMAVMTSAFWKSPAQVVDSRRPFLRPLAAVTPPVVFAQITLGALYRHNVIGIILHVAVAMAVALLGLIIASVVLQNFPRPLSLRLSAGTLMALILIQVSLGIASLVMLLLNFSATAYFLAATVAHVALGAATLAASIVMAVEVWRSIPGSANSSA